MTKLTRNEINHRFQKSLCASIGLFRNGEHALGMDEFLRSVDDLENVVLLDRCSGKPKIIMKQLIPELQKIYYYMQNQDIVGLTDELEYIVYPMSGEWYEG